MRKSGRKHQPPSTLTVPNQVNQSSSWPLVSQILKAMVASGVLLFVCNLGYDAAKATILRRLQLEEENKQLKTRLEMIEHKILPKVEQAQKDVKEIQAPLDLHDKLTPAQMDKLAFKARGVHAALEEIGYFVKLNTHAAIGPSQENDHAGLPDTSKLNSPERASTRQNTIRCANLLEAFPPAVHAKVDSLKNSIKPVASLAIVDFVREEPPNETAPDRAATDTFATLEIDRANNLVAPLADVKEPTMARNLEFEGLPRLPAHRHPDEVRAAVASHKAALQDCYKQALKSDPTLKGEIKVRFTVSAAGQVIAASAIASTTNNAQLERLILEKIRRWSDFGRVSPEAGNLTFRQTFVFVDSAHNDAPLLTTKHLASSLLSR